MGKKSFRVTVCLDIHQVTCPGVWLCPKGKIFLTLSLFKCLETTKQVKPIFPLKYHQRFVYDKVFDSITSLGELEREMESRNIKMELVQIFKGKLKMVTLGIFQAPLTSVLYPAVSGNEAGAAEVDLLFETCKPFPGIIAPKAEVSTRAVIEELRLCTKFTDGPVNPILIPSAMKCGRGRSRQRPVCHNRPSEGCTCCSASKQRPKTTGSRLSPNKANSTKCKAYPPPRTKSREEGNEEDEYACFTGELSEDSSTGRKSDDEQPVPEESKSTSDERQRRSTSPSFQVRKQQVKADIHPQPSDYDDSPTENEGRKSVRSSLTRHREDLNSFIEPDQNKRNHSQISSSNLNNLTRKSHNDESFHLNSDKTEGGTKPVCDCYTCPKCKQTSGKFMLPWKVYAAPPALEHCFCHSVAEDLDQIKHTKQDSRQANISQTTQTNTVCKCTELDEFTVNKQIERDNSCIGNRKKQETLSRSTVKNEEKLNKNDKDCETLTVGCCIDLSGKKPSESSTRRGTVEKRTEKRDKSGCRNIPMRKNAIDQTKCLCLKNKV